MIILLFTGQARTSPFADNAVHNSDEIMNSYRNTTFQNVMSFLYSE